MTAWIWHAITELPNFFGEQVKCYNIDVVFLYVVGVSEVLKRRKSMITTSKCQRVGSLPTKKK